MRHDVWCVFSVPILLIALWPRERNVEGIRWGDRHTHTSVCMVKYKTEEGKWMTRMELMEISKIYVFVESFITHCTSPCT
jgi:hypothetical protein